MAELLPDQQYIAQWDDDTAQIIMIGTTPGPAGSYEVHFDSIAVAIDAVDPGIVNWIVGAEKPGERGEFSWRLLERLIGDEPTRRLGALATTDERIRIEPPTGARPRRVPRWETERNATMRRVIIGLAIADDAGLLPYERALGRLEAFHLMSELYVPRDLDFWPQQLHDAAHDLLDLPPDDIDPSIRPDVAAVFETTMALLDDQLLAARLRRIAHALRPSEPDVRVAAEADMSFDRLAARGGAAAPPAAAMAPAPMPVPAQRPVEVAMHSLPNLVAAKTPSINRTSGDEYEVRLTDWGQRASGWWVRGFRGADAVPLAAVPMTVDGDDAVARFLVAPSEAATLVVDIVDDPGEPRPSASTAAFRAAVAAGKRAARFERLDQRSAAGREWQHCSTLHGDAGDDTRSAAAAARAARSDRGRRRNSGVGAEPAAGSVINDWIGPAASP